MKFKINTDAMSPTEMKAMHAFFGVMAGEDLKVEWKYAGDVGAVDISGAQLSPEVISAIRGNSAEDAEQFSASKAVQDFVAAVREEPAPPIMTEILDVAKDKDGLPWDERIHSSSKALNGDGTWRVRRNLADGLYDAVVAELKGEAPPANEIEKVISALSAPPQQEEPSAPLPDAAPVVEPSDPGTSESETSSAAASDATSDANGGSLEVLDGPQPDAAADSDTPQSGSEDSSSDGAVSNGDTGGSGQAATTDASHSRYVRDDIDYMSGPQSEFWRMIDGARTWISFKSALNGFTKSEEFLGWPVEQQQALRAEVWRIAKEDVGADVDHTTDPTAFVCWMYSLTTPADADVIKANLHVLKKEDAFKRMQAESQAGVEKRVDEYVAKLRG